YMCWLLVAGLARRSSHCIGASEGGFSLVANAVTDCITRSDRELIHHGRQRVEGALAGNQRVERRVAEERQRERHSPPRVAPRARGEAATGPTWDDFSVSGCEWKAPPRASGTMRSPYQLASTIVASKPAMRTAISRPAGEPLAWMTMSASALADGGVANLTPSARAIDAR